MHENQDVVIMLIDIEKAFDTIHLNFVENAKDGAWA